MVEKTVLQFGNLVVTEEANDWTVQRNTGRISEKTGGEIVQFIGYYSDLEHALRRVFREQGLSSKGKTDAGKLLKAIETTYEGIRKAVGT